MRARAVAVNRRAATVSFGTVSMRTSSVTVPMVTRVLSSRAKAAKRDIEIGGRLMRDMKRRRRTTLLKEEEVRPVRRRGKALKMRVFMIERGGRGRKRVKYERGSGRVSQGVGGRHWSFWGLCGECCAHGGGRDRYL